jgi:alkylation response protein AidB-like acyl-CoA dehydrogenase
MGSDGRDRRWLGVAEAIARDVLSVNADEVDRQGRWPEESVKALGASGLLGLTIPASHGGAAQGPRVFAGVVRILAEHCASTGMVYLMHVCACQVIAAAPFTRRDEILREIAAGRHLSTLAFSERGSRSHFWAPVSQVAVKGEYHRLTALKSWVTSAGRADSYVVSTRSASAKEITDSSLYLVSRDVPGMEVAGTWNGLGLRGNASAPMCLEDVSLGVSDRLGADGEGFRLMMEAVLPWFQIGSAAVSVGIARAATEATRRHLLVAKLEHQGQPLASLPNLRARLAQMQIAVDTQASFLDHAAQEMENPGPSTLRTILESKAAAAEAALQVTDLAMRTCGGAAFSKQLSVERNFRDARAGAVMAPTTDVLHEFIGRALLEMPLF